MSLDVYLTYKVPMRVPAGRVIPIREDGRMKHITYEEWCERYPDRAPFTVEADEHTVFTANITHNLNNMADEAGLYKYLWRPDELDITEAWQLLEPLRVGLAILEADPDRFRAFNPANGWGDYEGLVDFVCEYLNACAQYPKAEVSVWR